MKVYTYSEARQRLALVLEQARQDGAVRIQRRDGQMFVLKPERPATSPLDVKSINLGVTTDEIVSYIRESRRGTE